jgi:leucyl-tRNA synthetase
MGGWYIEKKPKTIQATTTNQLTPPFPHPQTKNTTNTTNHQPKQVTQDIDALSFNTAISAMMVFANHLWSLKTPTVPLPALETLTLLVSPFAPHLGEECWRLLGHGKSLAYHAWPEFEEALTVDDVVKLGVQVNGKTRGEVAVAPDAPEGEVVALATGLEKVRGFLEGKKLVKVIYVPGRILNLVAK